MEMEDYQSRQPPVQRYPISHNLAHQPYPLSDADHEPLDEEHHLVPLPGPSSVAQVPPGAMDLIAETPLTSRSPEKRKKTAHGKTRSTAGKPGAIPPHRPPQTTNSQPFADELQRLEDLAERINCILAERARQSQLSEPSVPLQDRTAPNPGRADCHPPQPRSPLSAPGATYPSPTQPPLDVADTEHLKQQAQRSRDRLAHLDVLMEAAKDAEPSVWDPDPIGYDAPPLVPRPHPPTPPMPPRPNGGYTPSPMPNGNYHNPFDPVRQRGEHESWRAAEELRRLRAQDRQFYEPADRQDRRYEDRQEPRDRPTRPPTTQSIRQQAFVHIQRLPLSRWFGLPRQAADRMSDAVMWIVVAAIARIAARYLVATVPALSPIVSAIMLAPAVLAIVLALFVPKTGLLLFYRLFLIMLGLFIGGKAF